MPLMQPSDHRRRPASGDSRSVWPGHGLHQWRLRHPAPRPRRLPRAARDARRLSGGRAEHRRLGAPLGQGQRTPVESRRRSRPVLLRPAQRRCGGALRRRHPGRVARPPAARTSTSRAATTTSSTWPKPPWCARGAARPMPSLRRRLLDQRAGPAHPGSRLTCAGACRLPRPRRRHQRRSRLRPPRRSFEFLPGTSAALRRLQHAGFLLIVVTNQSGIARGLYSEAAYERSRGTCTTSWPAQGIRLDAVYHCPHLPDAAVPAYRRTATAASPARA